jgi:hypothetical protein
LAWGANANHDKLGLSKVSTSLANAELSEKVVSVLEDSHKAWILVGTRFLIKVSQLGRVLLETMVAMSRKRHFHLILHHRLIPEVRSYGICRDCSMYSVSRTLVGDAPSQPPWHRY